MVYYGQDGVGAIAFRELSDQVHGYYLEGERRRVRRDVEQGNFPPMGEDLVLLAWGASSYIIRRPFFQPWPPVVRGDPLDCLVASWVTRSWFPVVVV